LSPRLHQPNALKVAVILVQGNRGAAVEKFMVTGASALRRELNRSTVREAATKTVQALK
jgi:hypothetical protein